MLAAKSGAPTFSKAGGNEVKNMVGRDEVQASSGLATQTPVTASGCSQTHLGEFLVLLPCSIRPPCESSTSETATSNT